MLKHINGILVIMVTFALFLLTPGAAYADEGKGDMELKVNGYRILLIFPTPAKVGENEFHVRIAGPDGAPLREATVKITAAPIVKTDDAPKTEVRAVEPVSITLAALWYEVGEYAGAISFPQSGHWVLVVDFIAKGEMLKAEFPLEVATNIPGSYGILAAFFGLNAFIIGAAAVIRRKPKHA